MLIPSHVADVYFRRTGIASLGRYLPVYNNRVQRRTGVAFLGSRSLHVYIIILVYKGSQAFQRSLEASTDLVDNQFDIWFVGSFLNRFRRLGTMDFRV